MFKMSYEVDESKVEVSMAYDASASTFLGNARTFMLACGWHPATIEKAFREVLRDHYDSSQPAGAGDCTPDRDYASSDEPVDEGDGSADRAADERAD